jgi:hypothetical protein
MPVPLKRLRLHARQNTARCSGLQTAIPEPANNGRFQLTFAANKLAYEPRITANEPTFNANSPPTAR